MIHPKMISAPSVLFPTPHWHVSLVGGTNTLGPIWLTPVALHGHTDAAAHPWHCGAMWASAKGRAEVCREEEGGFPAALVSVLSFLKKISKLSILAAIPP